MLLLPFCDLRTESGIPLPSLNQTCAVGEYPRKNAYIAAQQVFGQPALNGNLGQVANNINNDIFLHLITDLDSTVKPLPSMSKPVIEGRGMSDDSHLLSGRTHSCLLY